MPTPPRRRWFQFGLGALFALITLLAICAAWLTRAQAWIRERHAVVKAHVMAVEGSPTLIRGREDAPFHFVSLDRLGEPATRAPGALWLFGERGYGKVRIDFGATGYMRGHFRRSRDLLDSERVELDRIERLFPEAKIEARAYYRE